MASFAVRIPPAGLKPTYNSQLNVTCCTHTTQKPLSAN